ncbi:MULTISPECIES: hypothetical protein [Heyndrickxia]|jgi:uncharacterized membrane protein YcfT|uniref:Uncharacterized protein n=2 Tax=Heyndrickxia TaxID=2837504 RepID=G2TN98_HEYCO|nr:hypothetical protein [Heyndrickxia coagulans]AEP01607.1 hypothetical protein Bcoa_2429 [Heyndrickxia coagulans 36D1]APB36782.1 hypothetical protein BIZ35_07945 [Heyndrickxia coagulans]QPG52580.1 hypothetical protein IR208_11005 [Heyndrickxia coagulans]WNE60601.1 hypothetical protein KIY57_11425 [Heyndrickxia coagulans]
MLPEKFDENEIFTLAALAGLMLALYLLPKAVSWKAGLANGLFFTAMACFADEVLSAMHPLNLYNTFDSPDLELFDFIIYLPVFTLYGYLFITVQRFFRARLRSVRNVFFYLLAWIVFTCLMETIAVKFGVFHYLKEWNNFHSLVAYCFIFPIFYAYANWILKMEVTD